MKLSLFTCVILLSATYDKCQERLYSSTTVEDTDAGSAAMFHDLDESHSSTLAYEPPPSLPQLHPFNPSTSTLVLEAPPSCRQLSKHIV